MVNNLLPVSIEQGFLYLYTDFIMKYLFNTLILCSFLVSSGVFHHAQAETKGVKLFPPGLNWSKNHRVYREYKEYHPHLENSRHSQIPQWESEDWYVEDWTSQVDGMTLIQGFYAADILRDQTVGHAELPVLVVGPNFYHLSGLDKRRVVTTVDATYGMTARSHNASFLLTDWHTKMPIGDFDHNGLRLH